MVLLLIVPIILAACGTPTMSSGVPSSPLSDLKGALTAGTRDAALADRIQTKSISGVTLSACLLPDDEARQRYGVNLAQKGLQAVWLRASNMTPDENWLLTAHLDPDYFTPDEAAYLFRACGPVRDTARCSSAFATWPCDRALRLARPMKDMC